MEEEALAQLLMIFISYSILTAINFQRIRAGCKSMFPLKWYYLIIVYLIGGWFYGMLLLYSVTISKNYDKVFDKFKKRYFCRPSIQQHNANIFRNLFSVICQYEYTLEPIPHTEIPDEHLANYEGIETKRDKQLILDMINLAKERDSTLLLIGTIVFLIMTFGFKPHVLVVCALLYVMLRAPVKNVDKIRTMAGKECRLAMTDGCYRLYVNIMGLRWHCGIGYCDGGVLHSRYHVTGNAPVNVKGEKYWPTYYDTKKDFITWGGQPRMVDAIEGEKAEVMVVLPTEDQPIIYSTIVSRWVDEDLVLFKGAKTLPGCSGSPVFVLRDVVDKGYEGEDAIKKKYFLCGLIGKNLINEGSWYWGNEEFQIELINPLHINVEGAMVKIKHSEYHQCLQPPGSGKTRNLIPEYVIQAIEGFQRVFVSGPTRVVCKEIWNSLKDSNIDVGLIMKGATPQEMRRGAKVIVLPHAVLFSMVSRNDRMLRRSNLFIIDESHVQDSRTKALMRLVEIRRRETLDAVIELTATGKDITTGEDIICKNSNYAIKDRELTLIEFEKEIIARAENGHGEKIIVFCGSVGTPQTRESIVYMHEKLKKLPIDLITLHRNNFAQNYQRACGRTGKTMVILTTNIAECGANIDGDVVYDYRRQLMFRQKGQEVLSSMENATEAQVVQRRGRIGRTHEGEYVYVRGREPSVAISLKDSADEMDAQIYENALLDKETKPLKISKLQAFEWAQNKDYEFNSIFTTTLIYDENGRRRSKDELKNAVKEWMENGTVERKISGRVYRFKWFDDRDFTKLMRLAGMIRPELAPETKPFVYNDFKRRIENFPGVYVRVTEPVAREKELYQDVEGTYWIRKEKEEEKYDSDDEE